MPPQQAFLIARVYIITSLSTLADRHFIRMLYNSRGQTSLVDLVQLLHNHGASGTTTVADSSHTILASLQLVEKCNQDTRAGATKGVTNGDSTTKKVNPGVLKAKDL